MGFRFRIKNLSLLALSSVAASIVLLSGCGKDNVAKVQAPYPNNSWLNQDYQQVESAFRNAGFTNIVLVPENTTSYDDNGKVTGVSINSGGWLICVSYNEKNNFFDSDSIITIEYYEAPEPTATPEPSSTPEPIVYTTEVESLITLFEESAFDAKNHISDLEMQYLSDPGRVFISYNIENAWSEHDISFMAFTNYVRFVQGLLAYHVEGVTEVKISISSPVVDNYGNESTVPVLAWNMSIESFQQYNWENLTLREGVFVEFLNECETFWIAPFIEDEVDWNKVILWNTFEPEE